MVYNFKFDQQNVRKHHYFLLLSLIQKHKKISRSQLSKFTGISNTTVGKITKSLMKDDLIIEKGQTEGEIGRKASLLEINPKGAFIIGISIDINSIKIALVTLNGEIVDKTQVACKVKHHPRETLDQLITLTKQFIENKPKKILAIGISMPGLISWPDGLAVRVPQFNWHEVEVRDYLKDKLNFDIFVDNDVRSVLLAEYLFGNLNNMHNSTCIYIGSGVGSSVMINGQIVRGHNNMLGEIGHTTMNPNGALCDCGRLGCLQTYICISEIEKQTQRSMDEVILAYKNNEDWAVRVIDRAKNYLGIAISNIICTYNPEAVLLAGPLIERFPEITKNLEADTKKHIWSPLKESFLLLKASLGEDSDIIGASALVLNNFLKNTANNEKR
ncbi:ROK family transcriptional regulator [Gracilibacillus alcaliphilus]|uniref:ROK family transcriptional regulator n=1 Tax=Gracilibacillus alcaliphilus TaxID=1401441 RepID=UPI00195B3484|nr:ROK family transcriptional regulator [Gracilibacillus alcaliphilus]MBM7676830.1 putative NBD/HSP70 family sugar kinase [Gracilibacillus alcaliphilus]